ncbi:MAG TPA: S8 family serine peptidase, partial [Anaerolineales bacterium]|nr:S8 family serine peptidase [Anaerolineales bacterium]
DNNPQDDNGHGTHVAGIAAALCNNGTGVAGVSWGARLMPVKVLNAAGNGTYADVADGIIWAADHGAQIINLSLGGGNSSQMLQDAVDYAAAKSVVLVAAAGNAGRNSVFYPARYPNVIAVAATDPSNAHAGFSNYGPDVDLSAPGVSIYSTFPGGYGYNNGTSMATPFVSGLAAILRGIPGNSSPTLIASQMESTALDLGSPGMDDFYGYGLIQMDAAILSVGQNPTSTSPAPISQPGPARGFVPLPTFPPSATVTLVPTQTEAAPASPALTATQGPLPAISDTPEIIALETEIPTKTSFGMSVSNWFLPCCGASLILLGLLLFWMARQEQKKNRRLFRR